MDEPLSSLDAKLRAELRIELKRIQNELGATILYVTHDQTEAIILGSRVGVIENGRLVQVGTPEQAYEDPSNIYVAARLGVPPINLVPPSVFPEITMPENTAMVGARTEHAQIRKVAVDALPAVSPGSSISAIRTICTLIFATMISSPSPIPTPGSVQATKSRSR